MFKPNVWLFEVKSGLDPKEMFTEGGGGVTESRRLDPSDASLERGGGGGGEIYFQNCLCKCTSSHFEAQFSIFYNLNLK